MRNQDVASWGDPITGADRIRVQEDSILRKAEAILDKRIRSQDIIANQKEAKEYLRIRAEGKTAESFTVLYIGPDNRVLAVEEAFQGTNVQVPVFPREIIKRVALLGAAGVIVSHNHPNGSSKPSKEDIILTARLEVALQFVDTLLYEHYVVGDDGVRAIKAEAITEKRRLEQHEPDALMELLRLLGE